MIHAGALHLLTDKRNFSIKYFTSKGDLVEGDKCICTSWHSSGHTLNLKFCESGQIRKVTRSLIIEFNGEEVFQ